MTSTMPVDSYICRKILIPIFYLKLINYKFFSLNLNIFNFYKIENHLQNHPNGQIFPVSVSILSGFVV